MSNSAEPPKAENPVSCSWSSLLFSIALFATILMAFFVPIPGDMLKLKLEVLNSMSLPLWAILISLNFFGLAWAFGVFPFRLMGETKPSSLRRLTAFYMASLAHSMYASWFAVFGLFFAEKHHPIARATGYLIFVSALTCMIFIPLFLRRRNQAARR